MFNKLIIFVVSLGNINESIATFLVAMVIIVAALVFLLVILCCFAYHTDKDAGDQEWQQTKKGDR